MQEGYTLVTTNETTLKVIAEKQQETLRITAIPVEGDVKFELEGVETG